MARSRPSPGSRSSAQEPGPGSHLVSGALPHDALLERPVLKFPAHLSQKSHSTLVSTAFSIIDASSKGLLALVSPGPYLPGDILQALTPTLTTTAFDRSSLEWFEACFLEAGLEGPAFISYTACGRSSQVLISNLQVRALQHTTGFLKRRRCSHWFGKTELRLPTPSPRTAAARRTHTGVQGASPLAFQSYGLPLFSLARAASWRARMRLAQSSFVTWGGRVTASALSGTSLPITLPEPR